MTVADRALLRIREEMTTRQLTQRDMAERLKCSQGRIAKLLNGHTELRLNDIAELAQSVGLSLVEVIRDRGLEFFAELTPTEVRILELLRLNPHTLQGVMVLLRMTGDGQKPSVVVSKRGKVGRPRNSSRSQEDNR